MVSEKGRRYGIDFSGGRVRLIGRVFSNGQQSLDTAIDSYPDRFDQEIVDNDAEYYFSISENEAIVKAVEIPRETELNEIEQAQFELACSLLDSPEEYHLRISPTGLDLRYLAVAINRRLVHEKLNYLKAKIPEPTGFGLRSLAMARAFVAFCEHHSEEPVCLIDLDINRASYCFLYNDYPLMVGFVGDERHDLNPEDKPVKTVAPSFIMDLTAVLKFRLANLKKTIPDINLSKIILTGYAADPLAVAAIEKSTGFAVASPVFKKDSFAETIPPESNRFLTPLGLTIGD